VASLVIGILSIFPLFMLGVFLGPLAIGLSVNARRQINDPSAGVTGAGMATAGLITGIVGFLVGVLFVIGLLAS
jgi:hypothetical protein